jgi:hypothetical protein
MRTRIFATFTLLALATVSRAQSTRATVRVIARDSSGAPIPAAELTISRGLHDIVASGTTDDAGRATLSVNVKDSTDLQVTLRKIGYKRTDHFFSARPHDTSVVTIVSGRPLKTLAPVTVTAERNARWKSYHLDADDIEKADMPFQNAWDVVKRLRPDMLTSRGGCATGAREAWVNGKRIRLPLRPIGLAAAEARVGVPPHARFSYVPVSVLSDIAPEHIAEITYHDCFDTSMAAVGSTDAIFVVLKPGVIYQQDVGSFVLDTPERPTGSR